MFIPVSTDYRRRSTPWVNYALVAANVAIYLLGYNGATPAGQRAIDAWMLQPDVPQLWQFFSSVFLHAGLAHLLGNMVFLWVFGNAVNDKFGHVGYLAFYLTGGVLACVGYLALSANAPVLGASGAIAAVGGAYLVLLPRTNVKLIIWLGWLLLPVEVSSLYFLGLQVLVDFWMTASGLTGPATGGVAYAAHAAGYLFGMGAAAGLLAVRVLPRDSLDLLNLFRNWKRRQQYRKIVAAGYDPFQRGMRGRDGEIQAPIAPQSPARSEQEQALRRQIADALVAHDLNTACDLYLELVLIAEEPVLSQQAQLDVANQLMSRDDHAPAAAAYERFLRHYPGNEGVGDVLLLLGLLYTRYLPQPARALECFERAIGQLHDEAKLALAREQAETLRRELGA